MTNLTARHFLQIVLTAYHYHNNEVSGKSNNKKKQGLAIAIDGTSENKKSRKRRPSYEPTVLNIEPYEKKKKKLLVLTFYH